MKYTFIVRTLRMTYHPKEGAILGGRNFNRLPQNMQQVESVRQSSFDAMDALA